MEKTRLVKQMIKSIWRFLIGGGVTYLGWFLVQPELGETSPTVSTVIGVALIAVGVSVLAGVFNGS